MKPFILLLTALALSACGNSGPPAPAPVPASALQTSLTCAATSAAANFYQPPAPLPAGQPGDLIRCEPATTVVSTLSRATRIMYRSTDIHGTPIAVTGLVLEPFAPWSGGGMRPLIGFTVGTQGQGNQCAPSRLLSDGVHYSPPLDLFGEYEIPFITDFLL